jgi:alkylhydroperoxidase family enzyme
MARLPLVDPDDPGTDPETRALLLRARASNEGRDDIPWRDVNVTSALANHPGIMKAFSSFARTVYSGNTLSPAERELAWLATSAVNDCHY